MGQNMTQQSLRSTITGQPAYNERKTWQEQKYTRRTCDSEIGLPVLDVRLLKHLGKLSAEVSVCIR